MQSLLTVNCFDVFPSITNSDNVAAPTPTLLWADRKWIINAIHKNSYSIWFLLEYLCTVYSNIRSNTQASATWLHSQRCKFNPVVHNISHPDTNTVSVFIKPQAPSHGLITADMWAIHVDCCVGITPVRQHGIYYLFWFFFFTSN